MTGKGYAFLLHASCSGTPDVTDQAELSRRKIPTKNHIESFLEKTMPEYKCLLTTREGASVSRTVTADSLASLKELVSREGNFLIKASKIKRWQTSLALSFGDRRLKSRDFISFNHEFILLLNAGIPVVAALDALIKKENRSGFLSLLKEVRADVSHGEPLSAAFARHGTAISPMYVAAIAAGESDGRLAQTLAEYGSYLKRSQTIRQKIKAASIYPAILTVVSVFVVLFLLVFVVPSITASFASADAELPTMTRLLLALGNGLKEHWLPLGLAVCGAAAAVYYSRQIPYVRRFLDRAALTLPGTGKLVRAYAVARFSSTLSSVLRTGSTLTSAVTTAAGIVGNTHIREGLQATAQAIETGSSFSDSLSSSGVLPELAVRMVAAGEQGGSLPETLAHLADFYESDVETGLTALTSAIEPLLMVIMGFIIGFIVLAMYMPIFQLAGTIG